MFSEGGSGIAFTLLINVFQACWAIANIAGESAATRDMVLQAGILDAVEELFGNFEQLNVEFVRTLAWLHSNLCRHKSPAVDLSVLRVVAPRLKLCMNHAVFLQFYFFRSFFNFLMV